MPSNKFLIADKGKLLKGKLEKLAATLQSSLGTPDLQTKEQYIFESIKLLGEFYANLNEPQLNEQTINLVREDDLPDPELYNKIWQQLIDDLTIVYAELENIETLTVSNFNYVTTESNRLTSRLKSVSSKLGDFILYSLNPSRDAFFFKDSFNDLSKIDVNSPLLNSTECEISQDEGIITLPVNREEEATILIKESPIINPNSNGIAGNNQELGAPYNGSLSVLLDNNADTWFEFERVVLGTADDKQPLVLDMTINLGEQRVVNHIRVNPNNFGTKTVIQIDDIQTSIDGQVYTSIKDDIPIAGFTTQDEENIFSLAPSTSKFAGQGIYTFTPRNIKYIHFVFRQTEPYLIETPNGERLRYAIGLRDIDIKGFAYLNKGEIISQPFESIDEIRKVLLSTNQNPADLSELAAVEYSISPDDGASWHRIQPAEQTPPTGVVSIPEVLNFNSLDSGAIKTPVPVNSIRLKATLLRRDEKFSDGSSTLNKVVTTRAEIHQVPQAAPFTIGLEKSPVDGTVQVVDPLFGSRGIPEAPYIVGHGVNQVDLRRFRLPITNLPRPIKKVSDGALPIPTWHIEPVPASEWAHLEVGGEEWTQTTVALDTFSIDFQNLQNFKLYNLDVNSAVLSFGDSVSNTLAPASNQPVSLYFDAERLFPNETVNDHVAQLEFTTSNNKNDFTIKRFDEIAEVTELVSRKATVIRLEESNILDTTRIATSLSAAGQTFDGTATDFLNGRDELVGANSWSIDTDNGIIYLKRPTSATQDLSLTYTYQPITVLTTDDWEFATTDLLRDSVSINSNEWKTISIEDESLPATTGIKVLDLSKLSVVKGTLSITVEDTGIKPLEAVNPFLKEVDFINGTQELGGAVVQTTEPIPAGLLSDGSGIVSFELKENVSTNIADHAVTFSNTTAFATEVASLAAVTLDGEYFVSRGVGGGVYGTVYVMVDQTPNSGIPLVTPGKVTYFYAGPNFNDNGLYSVDYKRGRIFMQRPLDPLVNAAWTVKASYQYVDFRAEYRIARQLELDSYEVDITNTTVTLLDKEILKYLQIPKAQTSAVAPYYLINYEHVVETRENIDALKDHFSPVVKDYALRVLTKGNLF